MLSTNTQNQIESTAKELLISAYSDEGEITLPVNLPKIAKQYGIHIKSVKFNDPSISGAYDKESKTVYVSADDSYTRKSFTIAHELGHFILHKDKDKEVFLRTDIARISEEERSEDQEANWFAAALLMPEDLIKKYWSITKDEDKIAKIFGTSPAAVHFRLKNLDLI